jgi:EAL domain-containing protein (putative c-di-GMP-specific phosphodiesterase class I)
MPDLIVPDDLKGEPAAIVERLLGGEGVPQYTTTRKRKDGSALAVHEAARQIALGHKVSINLSTATVGRHHIVTTIADELREAGAEPENLTVEITETALMKNMKSAQIFAADLSRLGPSLALDDFGTGFGGFTYLK